MGMIIDTDNYAASGIKEQWFPGGEPHPVVPRTFTSHVHFNAKLRTWKDIGMLLAVCSAFEVMKVDCHVFAAYLPGARQDRPQVGFPFTAQMVAKVLGSSVTSVTAVDVHSESAESLWDFENAKFNVIPLRTFLPALITDKWDCVLAPDKGAVGRGREVASALGIERVAFASKARDSETGHLKIQHLPSLYDSSVAKNNGNRYRVLIADDICDGGRTFTNIISEARKQENYSGVTWGLYVTHGIFSQGLTPLVRGNSYSAFSYIYTTDSFFNRKRLDNVEETQEWALPTKVSDYVKMIDLSPYYMESLVPS